MQPREELPGEYEEGPPLTGLEKPDREVDGAHGPPLALLSHGAAPRLAAGEGMSVELIRPVCVMIVSEGAGEGCPSRSRGPGPHLLYRGVGPYSCSRFSNLPKCSCYREA